MDENGLKQCRRCKKFYPATFQHFHKHSQKSDGLYSYCKKCSLDDKKKYQQENKEKLSIYHKQWYENNKDSAKIKRHERYLKKREDELRKNSLYKDLNKETLKLKNAEYNRRTKVRRSANNGKRRLRIVENGGSFTEQEWLELCERYNNRCLCCGRNDVKLTVDHVVPLSKGGTNFINNIQPLCKTCNSRKYTKTIDYRRVFLNDFLTFS